ncbi:unnamed protein product [Callosobruchus maculatus]|uniref:Uncharacterized protein n=1 Tax=Callosobruchus maculatus TaxID=64391 RepID=A0A653DVV3_CALMS|nr:unnamed protein product [Callosobruchus maculatus]
MKSMMWKEFSLQDVTKKDEKRLLSTVHNRIKIVDLKTKLKVGDHIRIYKRHVTSSLFGGDLERMVRAPAAASLTTFWSLSSTTSTNTPKRLTSSDVDDEAKFTGEGIYNSRNSHIWDEENPHCIRHQGFQSNKDNYSSKQSDLPKG